MRKHNNKHVRTARTISPARPSSTFLTVLNCYQRIASNQDDAGQRFQRIERECQFKADVEITARRNLSPRQYFLFIRIYLLGLTAKQMVANKFVDTVLDYHTEKNRIEEVLGKAFRDTRPYPLYPLDSYFHNEGLNERRRRETASADGAGKAAKRPTPRLQSADEALVEDQAALRRRESAPPRSL